ncbi:MarR family transcriptional regulator [Synechococcus sp. MIT S9451]|uniref:MarR family transcriptional regulator n=1 Tax=Synechococcus sp. MIT S9451 TaxID=3082543 RepID=UPI0039B47A77
MNLTDLAQALEVFRGASFYDGLTLHHAQLLLFVGQRGSVTYAEIEDHLSLSNASVSRSVNALSSGVRHRQTCFELLKIERDLNEGRRYVVSLSEKGMKLLLHLEAVCQGRR